MQHGTTSVVRLAMAAGLAVGLSGAMTGAVLAQRTIPADPVLKEAIASLYPEGGMPAALGPANGQPSAPTGNGGLETDAVGPDVIIGGLMTNGGSGNDVSEAVLNRGSAGGFVGLAVGTTSCNIGTVNLLWDDNSTRKPVIGTAMYKLKNGRIEQIGYSWLKHGFTALTQNLCASCNGAGGWILGVGCADPYSATLNSSTSNSGSGGLGPRFEVNPFTGIQSVPWLTTASVAPVPDATTRRLRVASASLAEPTSPTVQYFVEGQYITPDDAAFGNAANNASYKQVQVTSTGAVNYVASTNAAMPWGTQRTEAAIYAWADFGNNGTPDPQVLISRTGTGQVITATTASWNNGTLQNNVATLPPAPVGDGDFLVGSRAYDNGDGTWRYEYAVMNFNSHRQGGSFTVPLPAGSTETAVSIRQTPHHSGPATQDAVRNTPWSQTLDSTSVSWASTLTAPPLVPPAGTVSVSNGLQWGMMSNFSFVSNVAPVRGDVTIGLYRAAAANDPNPASSITATAWIPDPSWVPPVACYANCDGSTDAPVLGAADFSCFLGKFRSGDAYANCDGSTDAPVLGASDFSCFLGRFRAGC